MKKIVLLLTCAFLYSLIPAKAQLQRGNLLVGADLANFNLDLNAGGNFSMRIDPKLAFFIKNNLAVGPYLNLVLSTAKNQGTNVGYGIGGLGRYYLSDSSLNLLRHGRFFVEGNVGIEGDNPSAGENTNGLGLGVGPGYAYFITPNIGLETLVKYQGIIGFGSKATSSNLNLSLGFQIYLSSRRAVATINELSR
jgi:hypothetical protein